MTFERGQDECADCRTPLPNQPAGQGLGDRAPCPTCGSTKRRMFATMAASVSAGAEVNAELIISWHEVDRLVEKTEYAAALLVAAVNVEFILWEHLRRFKPTAGLAAASDRVKSTWGQIRTGHGEMVSLSSLIAVAACFTQSDRLSLSPSWDPVARDVDGVRNRIAHERGYFALLTQLRDPDWPEASIRQVLESAKEFCHENAT